MNPASQDMSALDVDLEVRGDELFAVAGAFEAVASSAAGPLRVFLTGSARTLRRLAEQVSTRFGKGPPQWRALAEELEGIAAGLGLSPDVVLEPGQPDGFRHTIRRAAEFCREVAEGLESGESYTPTHKRNDHDHLPAVERVHRR